MDPKDIRDGHVRNADEDIAKGYYSMIKEMYQSAAEQNGDVEVFDDRILEKDVKKKNEFILKTNIPPFSQVLIEYIILLEWFTEKKMPKISQTDIYNGILRLEKAMLKSSFWELVDFGDDEDDGGPLSTITTFELNMVEQIMSSYIVDRLETESEQVFFFPLKNPPEPDALVTWRILERIAVVKIIPGKTSYTSKLKEYLKKRLKSEAEEWLENRLKTLKLDEYKVILNELKELMKILTDLMAELTSITNNVALVQRLFDAVDCHYWDTTAEAVESKLFPLCQRAMNHLDAYNAAHKEFHVNLRDSSTLCHAFYLQVKHLHNFLNLHTETYATERLDNFKDLFTDSFFHLLHVVKVECHSRIERAVKLEDEDTLEEEGITSSTVIVLTCLCTVLKEWERLQIEDEDMKIAFLVKTTEVLCDGCRIFAENMQDRAIDFTRNPKISDVLRQLCILGNNIQHIKEYISKLPDIMKWESYLKDLHDEDDLRKEIDRILNLVFQSTLSHLNDAMQNMLELIALHVRTPCEKFLNSWLKDHLIRDLRLQNIEKFIDVLHDQIEIAHGSMKIDMFQKFLTTMWISILNYINEEFQEGKSSDYSKLAKKNSEEIHKYFVTLKTEETQKYVTLLEEVLKKLDINSKTTLELQLDYFGQLADVVTSPDEYLGHIFIQAVYKKSTSTTIDITVKVQKAERIPVRKFDISDLRAIVEFCPDFVFPSLRPIETKSVTENLLNPNFDETFHFCKIPSSVLNVQGAVLHVIVVNQDKSYFSEVVLRLSMVQDMSGHTSIDFLPSSIMALKKPDRSLRSFQILEKRRKRDRRARKFVSRRIASENRKSFLPACIFRTCSTLRPSVSRIS